MMTWNHFLQNIADEYKLTGSPRLLFLEKYNQENKGRRDRDIRKPILEKLGYEESTYKNFSSKIYLRFKKGCPLLGKKDSRSKHRDLGSWLVKEYEKRTEEQLQQSKALADEGCQDTIHQAALDYYQQQQQKLTSNDLLGDYEKPMCRDEQYIPPVLERLTKSDNRQEKQRFEEYEFFNQVVRREQSETNNKRIAIIGEPGAGKTTTLQNICDRLMEPPETTEQQETKKLAVYLSLADLKQGQSLENLILSWLRDILKVLKVGKDLQSALVEWFNSGRVYLLLDGVDEIASVDPKGTIDSHLKGWVGSAHVVLTCQQNVWEINAKLLWSFETYRLLEFDRERVNRFIDKRFTTDAAQREELKKVLDAAQSAHLQDWARNPLMLAMLCTIWHRQKGKLPQTQAELIQRFVRWIYEWKNSKFKLVGMKRQKELNEALGRLALQNIFNTKDSSRFRLRESDICHKLGFVNNKNSLLYAAWKLGFLHEVNAIDEPDTGKKVYAFWHSIFAEYLAALAIDNGDFFLKYVPGNPSHPGASYCIFEPEWQQVFLLWLGREDVDEEQKEQLIDALIEFEDGCGGFYTRRAYLLAAIGIAEFKNYSRMDQVVWRINEWFIEKSNTQKDTWEALVPVFAKKDRSGDINYPIITIDEKRQYITNELIMIIDEKRQYITNELIMIIDEHQSEYLRLLVAAVLVTTIDEGNIKALDTIVAIIQGSPVRLNKFCATFILVKIIEDNSIAIDTAIYDLLEALVYLIQDSSQLLSNIQWGVAISFQKIAKDHHKVFQDLELLIDQSQSEDAKFHVASILGQIDRGNSEARKTLVRLIQESQDESIRIKVSHILRKITKYYPTTEDALEGLIDETQFEEIRWPAALIVNMIESIIPELRCSALQEYEFARSRMNTRKSQPIEKVVTDFMVFARYEPSEDNFGEYQYRYCALWCFARTLPYPEFYQIWRQTLYQIWHPSPHTPPS